MNELVYHLTKSEDILYFNIMKNFTKRLSNNIELDD